MALTSLLHLPGASKQVGRCLAIHIARIGVRPLCQDAAPIWGSVQSCDPSAHADLPERLSLPVQEREAVMRDGRFKEAGLDKADHQIDRSASNAQVRDQALFFTLQQHLDGTAWLHG